MHQVDDEPMQTLHIYLEREQPPHPSLLPIFLSLCALSILIALTALSPSQQPVARAIFRAPAVPLPIRTFTAQVAIIPTGVKTYPATTAHGVLTITNGSIIAQVIPAGFTISNVATDYAVYVPPGNANGYGYVTVSAHALVSGTQGNIPAYTVNYVEGSSVYIRNLAAFRGGTNSYSVKYATAQDRQTALLQARGILLSKTIGLHYPCRENHIDDAVRMVVAWRCQFVTYHIPAFYRVTGARIIGKNLLLNVWFVVRPTRIWVK